MTYTLDKNTLMLIADRSETGIVLLDDNLSTACEMNEAARRALPENKVLAEKECRRIAATVISGRSASEKAAPHEISLNNRWYYVGIYPFIVQAGNKCRLYFYLYLCPQAKKSGQDEKICAMKERCSLSERETQILRYMIDGESNKEISERLDISEHTVKRHIENIYDKLHIHGRRMLFSYFKTAA